MTARPETPSPPPGNLVTGTYRQGPRFNTYRVHGTHDWVLIYNLSGHARFGHAKGEVITKRGDMILLKPHTLHDYGTAPGQDHWEPLWAHFIPRPGWLEWLNWPRLVPGLMLLHLQDHAQQPRIAQRFQDMLQLNASADRLREELAMNALEEIVLRCDRANPHSESAHVDSRIRIALDYIGTHFAKPLTVARIAAECSLSSSRFAHLFRVQTGETPQRYLELQRLHRSCQLLEFTQEPIRLIAQQVGFENPFYFTLRFKKHQGIGPRLWRQRLATNRTRQARLHP